MTQASGQPWWERRWFALFLILASALPLLGPAIPPLVDVPGHIGRFHLMLGGSPFLDGFFRPGPLPVGNLGVDLIALPLARYVGVEQAVRIVVTLIPPATVAAMLWIAREAHGRLPPSAAFAIPLAYSQPFLFGFINFAAGLALALAAFAWWLRLGRQERSGFRALVMAPIALIIFVAHVSAWGVFGLLAFAAELIRQRARDLSWPGAAARAALHCAILALPLLLLLLWREGAGAMAADWFMIRQKAFHLASILRDRWAALDLAALFGLVALLVFARDDKRLAWSRPLATGALLLLITFLAMPRFVFGSAYADMRLAPLPLLVALLAIGPGQATDTRFARRLAVAATAFALIRLALLTVSLDLAADRHRALLATLEKLPPRSRLAVFVDHRCGEWALPRNDHIGSMAIVRRDSFANDQWALPGGTSVLAYYPAARKFAGDDSQLTGGAECNAPTLDQVLAELPADAFDALWLVDAEPRPDPPGWTRILAGEGNLLYRRADQAGRRTTQP